MNFTETAEKNISSDSNKYVLFFLLKQYYTEKI